MLIRGFRSDRGAGCPCTLVMFVCINDRAVDLAVDSRQIEWACEPALGKYGCEHEKIAFTRELSMADSAVRHRKAKLFRKAERLTKKVDSRRGIRVQQVRYDALFAVDVGHGLFPLNDIGSDICKAEQYLTYALNIVNCDNHTNLGLIRCLCQANSWRDLCDNLLHF
jgi:hypothetical protein